MNENPLGSVEVGKLMRKFAIPSIVSMLVTSIYNIVDQLFIGQAVGALGNAATNIAYPFTLICLAFSLMFGIGGAACCNLRMGEGKKDEAPYFMGNAFIMLIIIGVVIGAIVEIFLPGLLVAFGAPEDVLPYAMEYVGITGMGYPFLVIFTGGGHLVRADGSPGKAMFFNMSGAVINIVLDYLFTMVWHWGIKGAAYATVIGQVFSAILTIIYMTRCKTIKLELKHIRLRINVVLKAASLGVSSFINQLSMMIVQVTTNNLLNIYGADSIYGAAIPIACAGIVMKINQIVFGIVIGTSQGCQPIFSFNYGAKKYKRVREAYIKSITVGIIVSLVFLACVQIFPREIFRWFANGAEPEEYYVFGARYLKTFLMFVYLAALQPVTNCFFSAIGKPVKGMIIALVKQIGVLLPAMLILTPLIGVDGVMYAGPIADLAAGIVIATLAILEFRNIIKLEKQMNAV